MARPQETARRAGEEAKRQLEHAGFVFVQSQVPLQPFNRSPSADLVAWAGDESGLVHPYAAVEVKSRATPAAIDSALAQLTLIRDTLGTKSHYLYLAGDWLEADPSLRKTSPLREPPRAPRTPTLRLDDEEIATQLLNQLLWFQADVSRGRVQAEELFPDALLRVLEELLAIPGELPLGQTKVAVPEGVRWAAVKSVIDSTLSRSRYLTEYASRPDLAEAVANLLGVRPQGFVYDPFVGLGSFLWTVADFTYVAESLFDSPVSETSLGGADVNERIVHLANLLGRVGPYPIMELEARDSISNPLDDIANYVVSEPPVGLRLRQPYQLQDVGETVDGDIAVIDVALRALRPGGRAVLHLGLGWTSRGGVAQRYRDYLLEQANVIALIGLPAGAYTGTMLPSVLLVIENTAQTLQTFVAQLGEDWANQLGDGGAALEDFYRRTEG